MYFEQLPPREIEIRAESTQGITFVGVATSMSYQVAPDGEPYRYGESALGTDGELQPMHATAGLDFRLTELELDCTKLPYRQCLAIREAMAAAHPFVAVTLLGLGDAEGAARAQDAWERRQQKSATPVAPERDLDADTGAHVGPTIPVRLRQGPRV